MSAVDATLPEPDVDDIDCAIERWRAARPPLATRRIARPLSRREAAAAFRRVDAALELERGFPAELEDFSHRPRVNWRGRARGFSVELYGVALGTVVCERRAGCRWLFHPAASVAERVGESVVVGGRHQVALGDHDSSARIGEALNDAAAVCLSRLLACDV